MKKKSLITLLSILGAFTVLLSGVNKISNKVDNSPVIVLADELDEYKESAINLISNYAHEDEYNERGLRELHAWIDYGVSAIDFAESEEEIDEIVNFVIEQIDEIFLSNLEECKDQAKDIINHYADRRDYDDEGNEKITEIIEFSFDLIERAASIKEVEDVVEFAKREIDQVSKRIEEEENDLPARPDSLSEAKEVARDFIESYLAGLWGKALEDSHSFISYLDGKYSDLIDEAGSIDEVYEYLNGFINEVSLVPLKEDTLNNSITKHIFLLNSYVELREGYYSDENYNIVVALAEKGKEAIRSATTIEEVTDAYVSVINDIKTIHHELPFPEEFFNTNNTVAPGHKDPNSEPVKNNVAFIIVSVVGALAIALTIFGFVKLIQKDRKKVTE